MEMKLAQPNETENMLWKNTMLMPSWIQERIKKVEDSELEKRVSITFNKDGYPLCSYQESDNCFQITSMQPVREAERWADPVLTQGSGSVFMFGSGFAYPIYELFSRKQPHTLVIVFEQNLYLFKTMLRYFDFEPLIRTGKLIFFVGDIEDFSNAFNKLFFSIAFASCTFPEFAFTHAAKRNFKTQYKDIHRYVFSQLALYVFYIGNDHLDNLVGLTNLISNSRAILESPGIECLRDQYKGFPAFIIANGPSLDKNISELHRIQGRGLIISTESTIVPLLRNGIKPDILTIIERTKYTYLYHFENVDYPEDMALLCLGLVDKHVFPAFPGQKIPIFRNAEAINQWVNQYIGDGSAMDAGANVSHLAFELAVLLGADPIVFVGQDYAYGADGVATHSKNAVYNEDKGKKSKEYIQSMRVIEVEGNDGKMIPSNQLWIDFKRGLEQKIASHPDKTMINATEGGALISGTRFEKLTRVIDQYCCDTMPRQVYKLIEENKPLIDKAKKRLGLEQFIKSIENYVLMFQELGEAANKGKLECSDVLLRLERNEKMERDHLENAYQKNIMTYQKYLSDDLCRSFCQQVIFAYYYLMNRVGLIDTDEKTNEIFMIQRQFFQSLYLVCQSVAVHLEDAIKILEPILTEPSLMGEERDAVESDHKS